LSETVQAHTVPSVYLRNFSGRQPEGHVWNYDKSGNRWSCLPENTAKERYFYTATRDDGTRDFTLENYFEGVESNAKAGFLSLLGGQIPTGQERADFSTYLATQFVRTTSMRKLWATAHVADAHIKMANVINDDVQFNEFLDLRAKETGKVTSPELREKVRQSLKKGDDYIAVVPKEVTFSALLQADPIMEAIFDMTWSLCRPEAGYFITSDNPVSPYARKGLLLSPTKQREIFRDRSSFIDFPLSPKLLLLIKWGRRSENEILPRDLVAATNEERARRADRFLYGHISDDRVSKLLSKYKNTPLGGEELKPLHMGLPKIRVERS
jgi:hypothetical protein